MVDDLSAGWREIAESMDAEEGFSHDEEEDSDDFMDRTERVVKARETDEFDEEETDMRYVLVDAAYVSKELAESYERNGVYLMAQVTPGGVQPVAVGNEDKFEIDRAFDPEDLEGEISPLEILDNTEYSGDLRNAIVDYDITDLENNLDISALEEKWSTDYDELAKTGVSVYVAPGLEDSYREMHEELVSGDEDKSR